METRYRITFRGEVLDGHVREQVMQIAAERLGATIEQAGLMFSGRLAVLKKGLDPVSAQRYVAVLARIGMKAYAEPMPEPARAPAVAAPAAPAPAVATPPAAPAAQPAAAAIASAPAPQAADDVLAPVSLPDTPAPSYMAPPEPERSAGLAEPFDPERTHLAGPAIVGATQAGFERSEGIQQPFDARHVDTATHSVMPTMIVPPAARKPVAPQSEVAEALADMPTDAAAEHGMVATYLESIQSLTAEPNDEPAADEAPPELPDYYRPTPQRAAARMQELPRHTTGPATVTPIAPPQRVNRLPDPPTVMPNQHAATTIMVMGPDSDTPVPSSAPVGDGGARIRLIATLLGGAAVIALIVWWVSVR
ncbi:hypothetical protein [Niveibacterium sp.]|uniref:hypothetical protein n=1 Tax=Niveibacterium sp. TaxID=2017444 RepID=UPI0035B3E881